mgnify:FL=1
MASFDFQTGFHEYCWVCKARLNTADPPGHASCEDHHVVPRAYGGLHGPVVSLCASCHSKLHRLALSSPPYNTFGISANPEEGSKLAYLAGVVYNSRNLVSSDSNKRTIITFKVSQQEAWMADALKPVLGVTNRADVYRKAVQLIFSKVCPHEKS